MWGSTRSTLGRRARGAAIVVSMGVAAMATPAPAAPFAPSSPWNAPLPDDAPIAADSDALVAKLNGWVSAEVQGHYGPFINTTSYSIPVYTAGAATPTTDVILDWWSPALNAALQDVPIPAGAQPAAGSDQHLVVEQPSSDTTWEFWHMRQRLPAVASLKAAAGTGGSLGAARYVYKVSALTSQGETTAAPGNGTAVTTVAGGKVTLTWRGVVGATGYRIYRGTSATGVQRIATVWTSTTSYGVDVRFVDAGTVVPIGSPPTTNTANTPGVWHAGWAGRMLDVSTHPGYYHRVTDPFTGAILEDAPWGSTASSLPATGGLMRIAELQAGRIDHALQLAVPDTEAGAWVWPAQRTDGGDTSPDAIPEGAHFRLDPTLDLNSLDMPPFTRMMAEAAQRYGLIVNDRTLSVVTFRAEDPSPLMRAGQPNPYPPMWTDPETGKALIPWQLLAAFPWADLQLLA